jgi:SAM-dependent methyltransferase
MPTLEDNEAFWGKAYPWVLAGEEWSKPWGGTRMQWYGAILPRISAFVPTGTILEIAPGHGRWTTFLKDLCREMTIVDISETCIAQCRERFAGSTHIAYAVNDGKALDMVPDASVDFLFSFDSLVHAEHDVLAAYAAEAARILRPDGVAFIHHSNLGEYATRIALQARVPVTDDQLQRIPKLPGLLRRLGIYDNVTSQWRARSMTAGRMAAFAEAAGLHCVSQELVTWHSRFALVDCFSTLARPGSKWSRPNRVLRNPGFWQEAKTLAALAPLYGWPMPATG